MFQDQVGEHPTDRRQIVIETLRQALPQHLPGARVAGEGLRCAAMNHAR